MSRKDIFYDTDCLSCFISIDDVSILKEFSSDDVDYDYYYDDEL